MEGFDFHRLDNEITIGVNFTFKFYETTHLIWSDIDLYPQHRDWKTSLDGKKGIDDLNDTIKWVQECVYCDPFYKGIKTYKRSEEFYGRDGMEKGLYGGVSGCYLTGIIAVSFAIAQGFEPIYLMGYDCKRINGKLHHHDLSRDEDMFSGWIHLYDVFKGYPIFNCSLESLLPQFPKISIDEVLNDRDGHNPDAEQKRETVKMSCVDTLV